MKPRVLLHVQHLLGVGHDRRAAALARALTADGFHVAVARGGHPVSGADFTGAEVIQLPPARTADATFKTILDESGAPIDDVWRERRRALLLDIHDRVRPDAVIVESFPFARRAFRFELIPLLEAARAGGALTVTSVRDILVSKPDPKRAQEVVETARALIDRVLVHGDPALTGLEATFPAASQIADRLAYTGYVTPPPGDAPEPPGDGATGDGAGEVVVSVGGGAVGLPLLWTALAARPLTALATARWRLLAGPDVPAADVAALQAAAAADANIIIERARPDFPGLLRRCRLSISQAGYNTVLDVLGAGCRAVVVPFAAAGETEQALRADLLARQGRLTATDEAGLTPQTLAAAIAAALAAPPLAPLTLRRDGARESARLLRSWLTAGA